MKTKPSLSAVLVSLLAIVIAILAFATRSPTYQGKPVSYWFRELQAQIKARQDPQPAGIAFQKMGPDAVPFLLDIVRSYDTLPRRLYRWIYPSLPIWVQGKEPRQFLQEQDRLTWDADHAMVLCGPGAIPQLNEAVRDHNRNVRLAAVLALGNFSKDNFAAAQGSMEALDDESGGIRAMAMAGVEHAKIPKDAIVPKLVRRLHDDDRFDRVDNGTVNCREIAARFLGAMGGDAGSAVSELNELMTAKPWVASSEQVERAQVQAALSIWKIKSELKPTLPFLIEHIQKTQYPQVRRKILEALLEIGPAAKEAAPAVKIAIQNMVPGNGPSSDAWLDNESTAKAVLKMLERDSGGK